MLVFDTRTLGRESCWLLVGIQMENYRKGRNVESPEESRDALALAFDGRLPADFTWCELRKYRMSRKKARPQLFF